MQTERCIAGVDVHKKMLAVVVGQVQERTLQVERAKFGTTTEDLESLCDWLQTRGVEEVVLESTGQYHKPVWLQKADSGYTWHKLNPIAGRRAGRETSPMPYD